MNHICAFYKLQMPAPDLFKAFRMPLYFFLSGFFFKTYSGFFDFFKRKVNKLLVPFLFWFLLCSVCITLFVSQVFGVQLENANYSTFLGSLRALIFGEVFSNSAIWFLLCLFEVNILFYIIVLLSERFKLGIVSMCVMTALLGCLGITMGLLRINLPIYIDSSLSALPFFVFGYFINRYTSIVHPNRFDKLNLPIAIVFFIIIYFFAGHYSLKFNYYDSVSTALFVYPCGILGTMGVFLISKAIKKIPVVSWWGRYSIMILVTHKMLFQLFAPIITMFGLSVRWELILNMVFTFSSYFLLIPFMKKYMPHVTAQKDVIKV